MNRFALLAGIAALTLNGALTAQSSAPVVIQHVTVIDGTGAAPQRDVSILIVDGRVREMGAVPVPAGAQTIDARGKFVIPGLADMHVHTASRQRIEQFAPLFIASGVTTVRDMFGDAELAPRLKQEIELGSRLAPRLISPGGILDGPSAKGAAYITVATPEQGREAVRAVKQRGADFVKVYTWLSRDAYFAIADEAKKQQIPFAGHVPWSVTAAEASDSGQRSIEHLTGLNLALSRDEARLRKEMEGAVFEPGVVMPRGRVVEGKAAATYDAGKAEALFERFVRNGTWQVPTLTVLRSQAMRGDPALLSDPRLKYMPAAIRTAWKGRAQEPVDAAIAEDSRRLFARYAALVGEMHRAGVRILAGTDTANPHVLPGFSLHDELALLVRSGLSPLEALQAATRNAAEFLGTLRETGTVERGKRADLVVLDANPLDDISNTRRIHAVVVNGRVLSKERLDTMLADVEKANRISRNRKRKRRLLVGRPGIEPGTP